MTPGMAFQCPLCKQPVPASPTRMGQVVPCPSCKGEFRLSPACMISNAPAVGETKPAAAPVATATVPQLPPVMPPAASAAAPPKKTARFAAAVNAPSTVTLTSDGKLPELQLTEALSKAKGTETKKGSNPLLLIAVFTVSALCTLLMLFSDPSGAPTVRNDAATAHQELQHYYLNVPGSPKAYHNLLRESQRAYARGDRKTERDAYKKVLEMLHAEGLDPYKGMTGTPSGDRDLERLLGVLLRTDEN